MIVALPAGLATVHVVVQKEAQSSAQLKALLQNRVKWDVFNDAIKLYYEHIEDI